MVAFQAIDPGSTPGLRNSILNPPKQRMSHITNSFLSSRIMEDPGDERLEQRAVIKFLFREGVSGDEIHQRLVKVYKDDAVSYSQVKFRGLSGLTEGGQIWLTNPIT
ncbi:hypothetical protein M514_10724 [Trichuris suis]|uniref:Mos1 transposase HTH domain-containing protein n=1 Tax=Trichuris suis TaxID=68888 RepID=A0A085MZ11_9BILA|nr:hypothetical protein M513_10724 [Trichuris suis]KFD62457.1 hypothetical protein M514_10724 [Trichuris suis]